MESKEDIIVIDARSPEAYQYEHIPGAISFPYNDDPRNHSRAAKPEYVLCHLLRRHWL